MPAPATLPDTLRDAVPSVAMAMPATIGTGVVDGVTNARLARAAMIACYQYAPAAPHELLVEGAIRLAAYLAASPPHAARRKVTDPTGTAIETDFRASMSPSALRHSGASALLGPHRVTRGFEGF